MQNADLDLRSCHAAECAGRYRRQEILTFRGRIQTERFAGCSPFATGNHTRHQLTSEVRLNSWGRTTISGLRLPCRPGTPRELRRLSYCSRAIWRRVRLGFRAKADRIAAGVRHKPAPPGFRRDPRTWARAVAEQPSPAGLAPCWFSPRLWTPWPVRQHHSWEQPHPSRISGLCRGRSTSRRRSWKRPPQPLRELPQPHTPPWFVRQRFAPEQRNRDNSLWPTLMIVSLTPACTGLPGFQVGAHLVYHPQGMQAIVGDDDGNRAAGVLAMTLHESQCWAEYQLELRV